MEYGVCFFDVGNNVAGRDRPSNAGTAAVYAAAVRCTGDHGVSSVVSCAHGLGGLHLLCAGGTCGTVLGGIPDPCGERNGSVTIRFGKMGLLTKFGKSQRNVIYSNRVMPNDDQKS